MKVRRKKNFIRMVLFLFILAAAAGLYIDNNVLQVSKYTVTSNKIPSSFKGFKILQLSDLHSKKFGKYSYKLIRKINSEKPDIIVMTGDMVNSKDTDFEVFIDLAKQLCKRYDTYYIIGNHEEKLNGGRLKLLTDKLNTIGIRLLDNEKVTIVKGKDSINLYGLQLPLKYYKYASDEYTNNIYFGVEENTNILGSLNSNLYNILLTHNPLYFDTYSSWGADLTLAGHIHGGMIRIPFVGGLLSPQRVIFPKYDAGEYQISGKVLIVNRGLGNGNFGIRIFNRPEISVITLSD